MATIKEVADYAGVSVATISRVLNDPDKVKDDTKTKVVEAIKALHYSPNVLGRNLRVAHTKTILVLIPTIANDFYSSIITGIRCRAEKDGYHIMIGVTDSDPILELGYMNLLETKSVDGVILLSPRVQKEYLGALAQQYPMIQCCEYVEGLEVSLVTIDNYQAAYEATTFLINLGHERIGFIGGKGGYISARLREKGFRQALQDQGISLFEEYVTESHYSYKSGGRACAKLMALSKPPTAIFTVADSIAVGAIKKAQEIGLKIGKDLDIVGFDDTAIASMYNPPITTVGQPRFELGEQAYLLLIKKIKSMDAEKQTIYLAHTIKVRETTKKRG